MLTGSNKELAKAKAWLMCYTSPRSEWQPYTYIYLIERSEIIHGIRAKELSNMHSLAESYAFPEYLSEVKTKLLIICWTVDNLATIRALDVT